MNTSSSTLRGPTVRWTGKTLPSRWNIAPSANSYDSPARQISGIKQHRFLKYSCQTYTPTNEQPQDLPASPFLCSPWTANLYPPLLSSHKHGLQRGQTRHHLESEQVPAAECQIRIISDVSDNLWCSSIIQRVAIVSHLMTCSWLLREQSCSSLRSYSKLLPQTNRHH